MVLGNSKIHFGHVEFEVSVRHLSETAKYEAKYVDEAHRERS